MDGRLLTVACYLWGTKHYTPADVFLWERMVDRHLTVPHETVCITDDTAQFDGTDIRAVQLDPSLCYGKGMFQQLTPFSPTAQETIGERILTMDLDCAIVGNMDALVQRDEDLVLWRNPARRPWLYPEGKGLFRPLFNGSMMLVRTGDWTIWRWLHTEAMERFDSQGWISMCVGPDHKAYWDDADGVYRLEREDTPGSGLKPHEPLPANARVVYFIGSEHKPHLPAIQAQYHWINEVRV